MDWSCFLFHLSDVGNGVPDMSGDNRAPPAQPRPAPRALWVCLAAAAALLLIAVIALNLLPLSTTLVRVYQPSHGLGTPLLPQQQSFGRKNCTHQDL